MNSLLIDFPKLSDDSGRNAVGRLITGLVAIYPDDGYNEPQSWPMCAKLTPHLVAQRLHFDQTSVDSAWPKLLRRAQSWPLCAALARHLIARRDPPFDEAWLKLLRRAGNYFRGRASYSQSEPLFRDALTICEKALGSQHPETFVSRANLATLLREQGGFQDAFLLQADATKFPPRVGAI